jgi:autotransporter passenger strand-loop-strand repeat protein
MSGAVSIQTLGGVPNPPAETITPGTFAVGINLSGMEYNGGPNAVAGTTYVVPTLSELTYYKSQGQDVIRLPISWESMQTTLGGPLNATYLANVEAVVANAASLGMKVILDIHDYGGYNGVKIGTPGVTDANFANLWKQLATAFVGNPGIGGYDLMNEPSNMPSATAWTSAAQAAITAIRGVDTATPIYVEGNNYANAANWSTENPGFAQLVDPSSNLVFSAHVYLDNDGSGTHFDWAQQAASGDTTNIGVERLSNFVTWLQANNLKGDIGEIGVGNDNPNWLTALDDTLAYAKASNLQVTYWAGGPWLGSYPMSVEPVNGVSAPQMAVLDKYSGDYPNVTVASVSGTAAPNATIYLSENEVVLATTTANASGAWSYTLTGLSNGVHIIVAGESLPTVDGTIAATVFNLVQPGNNRVGDGGQVVASAGSPANGAIIVNGGTETVLSGGVASGTAVSNGGLEVVVSGGTSLGTTVASGGTMIVLPGAIMSGTVVVPGGNVISTGVVTATASGFVADGAATSGMVVSAGNAEYVLSGGTDSGAYVGGIEIVYSGGAAVNTTVESGGMLIVSAGATSGVSIKSGGAETVSSGGVAISTTITSGGTQTVLAGGVASSTVVQRGGIETVSSGGATSGSLVNYGGAEFVSAGGVARGGIVASSGSETVSAGGLAVATVVSGGGTDMILSGGIASGTLLNSGGTEVIAGGGESIGTVVKASAFQWDDGTAIGAIVSGTQTVSSGATATGTAIASGGLQRVYSAGIVSATVIGSGGYENISAGADAFTTTINAGGMETVYSAGISFAADVLSGGIIMVTSSGTASGSILAGGTEVVSSGGVSNASLVSSGGSQVISSGGMALGAVISAGGSQIVSSGGYAGNTVISSGGVQTVFGGGRTGAATIMGGGTEALQAGAVVSGAMAFLGNNGTLSIAGTSLPTNVISGFDANGTTGDDIVLTGYSYSSADSVTLSASNLLTINLNGTNLKLQFNTSQSYTSAYFAVETNSLGQVVIVDPPGKAPSAPLGGHAILAATTPHDVAAYVPPIPKIPII